ncbi:hypothetical protein Tco_0290364 [Tanacetum coccineum]
MRRNLRFVLLLHLIRGKKERGKETGSMSLSERKVKRKMPQNGRRRITDAEKISVAMHDSNFSRCVLKEKEDNGRKRVGVLRWERIEGIMALYSLRFQEFLFLMMERRARGIEMEIKWMHVYTKEEFGKDMVFGKGRRIRANSSARPDGKKNMVQRCRQGDTGTGISRFYRLVTSM